MAFWGRLLAGSDWSHLASVMSSSLFDVISARELSLRAAELCRNWFDQSGYQSCVEQIGVAVDEQDIGLTVTTAHSPRSRIPFRADPWPRSACPLASDGAVLLKFFFRQIFASERVFLDLRDSRFRRCPSSTRVVFHPLPLWAHWSQDFADGIRDLYRGFYLDQPLLFAQATRALGVSAANSVFEQAFGGANKHASHYSMAEFRDTFHQVFLRCRDAKTAIHPDFVTLGIMLATLYDHLECLGGVYDVQSAFQSATRPTAIAAALQPPFEVPSHPL